MFISLSWSRKGVKHILGGFGDTYLLLFLGREEEEEEIKNRNYRLSTTFHHFPLLNQLTLIQDQTAKKMN